MRLALVLSCSVALLGTVGTASAQDWTKSKWGPNDEIGAANYMTPELVLKAASLVKTGKTYALGIPVDSKTPAYPPRGFKITSAAERTCPPLRMAWQSSARKRAGSFPGVAVRRSS